MIISLELFNLKSVNFFVSFISSSSFLALSFKLKYNNNYKIVIYFHLLDSIKFELK